MVKSYVTSSDYYVTHKGFHIGFMQYDGISGEIKLCMLRIDLGLPHIVRDRLVYISRTSRVDVMAKLAEVLEYSNIGYEVCIRIITQADLQFLAVGRQINSQVRGAARAYFSDLNGDIADEVYMKELTRKPYMDIIYLYYLGQ